MATAVQPAITAMTTQASHGWLNSRKFLATSTAAYPSEASRNTASARHSGTSKISARSAIAPPVDVPRTLPVPATGVGHGIVACQSMPSTCEGDDMTQTLRLAAVGIAAVAGLALSACSPANAAELTTSAQ